MSAHLFPSASVGRAQGTHIARESLAVHPLLNAPDSAKYVPYTPRQRQPTPTPATLVPPTTSQGSVPAKSLLTSLRTAAQSIGLDSNSVGWAILEKISFEGDTSDEWSEIWNALVKSRATLLLPSETSAGRHDSITPEFVHDHLVLCDLASRTNTAVVTLSGLRGHLVNDSLTFRSTLHRSSKQFQGLWAPSVSRVASLDALPPLPAYPPESSYPSFNVTAFSATLPLPSRATKPPLPPRPGARGAPASSPARLPMPFASLFGQRPSTPPPSLLPTTTTTAPTVTPVDIDATIDISALVVDTAVSRTDIATGVTSALKAELAIALNDQPPWIVERVHTFALPYLPFVKLPAGKKKLQDIGGNTNRVVYAVNGTLDNPDDLADKFQAFYRAVEAELRSTGHVRADSLDTSNPQETGQVVEEHVDEAQIRDVLETIEETLCTLLYDRLFLPSTSDDASHNEALSSRVAALNMLDLGLEHLDIDIGNANKAEVDAVVRTCGQTLAQLDLSARSPREKAAVLVSAHKLVVEGLSKIPPIRLKSRDDTEMVPMNPSSSATEIAEHARTPADAIHVPPTKIQSPSIPTIHLSTSPDQSTTVEQAPSSKGVAPPTSSPVSGDVLLPILIFSVVKANPSKLVSHLLFTQRFRNQSFGGEESYCLINLMAVAEFLENVDLGALGLGESEKKVVSTADLTPISITRLNVPESPIAPTVLSDDLASLRGRVGQGVDVIAGSANKVISGVVDTSFGVLRALLPGQTSGHGVPGLAPLAVTRQGSGPGSGTASVSGLGSGSGSGTGSGPGPGSTNTAGSDTDAAVWGVRPSLGLLRRETGFSIAGLTAALPGGAARAWSQSHPEDEGQREMVEVASRPASLKSHRSAHEGSEDEDGEDGAEEEEEEEASTNEGSEESERDGEEGEGEAGDEHRQGEVDPEHGGEEGEEQVHDTRSIKSFESMLGSGRTRRQGAGSSPAVAAAAAAVAVTTAPTTTTSARRRKRLTDLTDRLTHGMAGMSRRVQGGDAQRHMAQGRLPPPHRRFMECTEQDIRVSEVGELLREYQQLVEAVRNAGGFHE